MSTEEIFAVSKPGLVHSDGSALRYNSGKPRFDLAPPEAMIAYADHCRLGANKYGPRNWEKGMAWMEGCFAPLQRHAWAFANGESYGIDDKTGEKFHHMIAVAWNAFALYTYDIRQIGTDDRNSR